MSARRKNKISSAAHIKRNTEGTSNEISFSVLDAAKMELEGKIKRPEGASPLGRVSLFTMKGSKSARETTTGDGVPLSSSAVSGRSSSTWSSKASSSEYEIARRKSRRRLHRLAAGLFVAVASVAIIAAVGTYAMSMYHANEGGISTLQEALALVSDADETLAVLDSIVEDPVNPAHSSDVAALEEQLPSLRDDLETAYSVIEGAFEGIVTPRDREAATSALSSVDARIDMIDHGEDILAASKSAVTARENAAAAWNDVLTADNLAREATSIASEGTEESISRSRESTASALEALSEAAYLVTVAEGAYEPADLSAFSEYIAKRTESLNHALASDDAFLAEDSATALSENDLYNAAEGESAELAKALPASIVEVIEEAFATDMAQEIAAYGDARTQAASTDAYLRTYRDV